MKNDLQSAIERLDAWIEQENFKGWDPFDALNSPVLSRLARQRPAVGIVLTQALRYLPINLRPLLGIRKVRMTKTVSLVVQAYLNLAQLGEDTSKYLERARKGLDWLVSQQISGFHGACWGYSHDWQSRSLLVLKSQPSLVCTAFVARAFLSAYEQLGEKQYFDIARSSCDFVLQDIPRHYSGDNFCFSYVPFDMVLVHNANLLGAELLARVYRHRPEQILLKAARSALEFTIHNQRPDGSWYYDAERNDGSGRVWIDNFHTGFVLESLLRISRDTGCDVQSHLNKGLNYYDQRFFAADGRPKRSSKSDYPVDLRDCAQAIIANQMVNSPGVYRNLNQALEWTLKHMRLGSGLFSYQRWPLGLNPIVYSRFQAWMLYSLSCAPLLSSSPGKEKN